MGRSKHRIQRMIYLLALVILALGFSIATLAAETTEITATKEWVIAPEHKTQLDQMLAGYPDDSPWSPYLSVGLQLWRSGGTAGAGEAVPDAAILQADYNSTSGTTSVTWQDLPVHDPEGLEYTYFAKEVYVGPGGQPAGRPQTLGQFTKKEEGLKVTNT